MKYISVALLCVIGMLVGCAPAAAVATPTPIYVVVTNTVAPTAPPAPEPTASPAPAAPEPTTSPVPAETATTAPVEPTVAPTAATVSCAAEAAPFKAQVLAVRSAYRPLVDQVYRYTLELVDAEFDASRVDRAFADIESIPIPECVDVGEVIYYFRLMRDTLSPAYIEMNIESNGHYPSPESFTRVKGWYAEIKSFDENIDAILATIPTE